MSAGLLGVLAVVAISLGGLGSLSTTSSHDTRRAALAPLPRPDPHRRPAHSAVPLSVNLAPPAPATRPVLHLRAVLSRALAVAGPDSGAIVYDLGTRQDVFARRSTVLRPPASVEKLYTTVALLRVLGPQTRLHTAVMGAGHLTRGVWHGDLYLRGGGDPTFGDAGFNRVWSRGLGANAGTLVAALLRRGIRRVTGRVYADESLFDRRRGGLLTGYKLDTPDFGGQLSALTYDHGSATNKLGPARFADKEFVLTLRGAGIAATAAKATRATPPGAVALATVASPPLETMLRLMDVPSDDLYAELFTKQLGVLFGGGGTIASGAKVIRGTIAAAFALHPTILDGSGLSRDDRTSPAEVVDMLRDVWHSALGRELAAALPTVGVEGTVQYLGVKTPARGRCIAKTGTLDNVTNLAGYCHSRSGRNLAFGMFIDGPPNYTASVLESRMVGAIAGY